MSNIAPPAAALVGIGFGEVVRIVRERRWLWLAIPGFALAATAFGQRVILRRPDSINWRPALSWAPVLGAAAAVLAVLQVARRRSGAVGATTLSVGLMALAPLLWTQSSLANGVTPQLPYAQATGLSSGRQGLQPNGGFTFPAGDQKKLVAYLRSQRTDEKWLVAVQSAGQAESIIISSGEPVMTLGGFIGSDPIVAEAQLRAEIVKGEVRYFLVGGGGGGPGGGFGRGSSSSFVSSECSEVPTSTWQSGDAATGETSFSGGPTSAPFTRYDCKAIPA